LSKNDLSKVLDAKDLVFKKVGLGETSLGKNPGPRFDEKIMRFGSRTKEGKIKKTTEEEKREAVGSNHQYSFSSPEHAGGTKKCCQQFQIERTMK